MDMCQSEIQRYGRSQGMKTNPHHELADFCIGIGSLLFGGKHLHPSVSDVCPNQKTETETGTMKYQSVHTDRGMWDCCPTTSER